MRLRNRQTGKVYTLSDDLYIEYTQGGKIELRVIIPGGSMSNYYDSLAELNEEWEDYAPKEPLIKDEKIRKAVIAWAKANNQRTSVFYQELDETHSCISFIDFGGLEIEFNKTIDELTSGKIYKFTELCGEEQE